MTELRRWLEDDPPPHVRRLLDAGQWERPSPAALERTLELVRLPSMAGASNVSLIDEPSRVSRIALKWTLVGVVLMGSATAVLAPEIGAHRSDGRQLPTLRRGMPGLAALSRTAAVDTDPSRTGNTSAPGNATLTEATSVGTPKDASEHSTLTARRKPTDAPSSQRSRGVADETVCKPSVGQQIEILEQAKREILAGRGNAALTILQRYDGFGAGRCFVLESQKYRMDAYVQTGNLPAARRVAQHIKTHYPDTAQAREAEGVLKN